MQDVILIRKYDFQFDKYASKQKNRLRNINMVATIQILSLNLL